MCKIDSKTASICQMREIKHTREEEKKHKSDDCETNVTLRYCQPSNSTTSADDSFLYFQQFVSARVESF